MWICVPNGCDACAGYWFGCCIGLACGYLWGYRSAVIYLGGGLHPERGEVIPAGLEVGDE